MHTHAHAHTYFILTSGTLGVGLRTTFSSNTFSLMRTQATFREPRRALGLKPKLWPSGENSSRVCSAGFRRKWLHSSTRRSISALLKWRERARRVGERKWKGGRDRVWQKEAQVEKRGEGEPVKATGSIIGLQRICNISSGKRKVIKVSMNDIL